MIEDLAQKHRSNQKSENGTKKCDYLKMINNFLRDHIKKEEPKNNLQVPPKKQCTTDYLPLKKIIVIMAEKNLILDYGNMSHMVKL